MVIWLYKVYSESNYSVESVSGKYLKKGWSDLHGYFSIEFVIEKIDNFIFLHLMTF